jgi:hypothetical protein
MARSMYRIQARFGLKADSFEEFVSKPIREIRGSGEVDLELNEMSRKRRITTPVGLSRFHGTLREYWVDHTARWHVKAKTVENLRIIRYERLMDDFDFTMNMIRSFLGSDKTEFTNIQQRVGYYPAGEGWDKGR